MRVLICSAGNCRLDPHLCLERRGRDPVVTERAPHLRDDGHMIDFFGSGFGAAERPPHLILRDPVTRMSTWSGAARLLVAIALTVALALFIVTSLVLALVGPDVEALMAGWVGLGPAFSLF